MIPGLTRFLKEHAGDWGLPQTNQWRFLFHNNYHTHASGVNVFWFEGQADYPSVVTKMWPRYDALSREFEALQHLYPRVPVPHALHFEEMFGYWALWMKGVPGTRMNVDRNRAAALHCIGGLLIPLHLITRESDEAGRSNRYERMVERPLETVARFGDSQTVKEAIGNLSRVARPEWLNPLPSIQQHGDFWPGNIISDHRQNYIVDWEGFGLIDLPLYDLVTCSMSIARIAPGRWDQSTVSETARLAHEYASTFKLSAGDVELLFPVALCNWFHIHATEGRAEFCRNAYGLIEDYFAKVNHWGSLAAWSAQPERN